MSSDVFLNCSNLTSVTIPESVTEIGMGAFNSCLSLTSITIPEGVTYIDEFTFNECHSLTSVVIPRSVTRIALSAFAGCDGLKDVYYAGSQSQWNGIEISDGNDSLLNADIHFDPTGSTGSGTFGDNLTWSVDAEGTLTISGTGAIPDFECVMGETPNYSYCGANTPWHSYLIRKVIVDEGITAVGSNALAYLEKMESISLPASLRKLGTAALLNDFGLKQIVLPENLETLGESALFQCMGLSSLHIPAGVKSIGEYAIDGCRLDSITVDEANTAFCAEDGVLYTKDKKELLAITSNRTELTIPDSVTRVDSPLFFDGQNIVSVTIGAQCDWGMNLSLCNSLEQITVVDSNPYLCAKDNVLFSKDGTELIVYPSARPGTSYTVPAGTKKIGAQAFGDCQNLTSIVLPDGLTEIDFSGIGCAYLAEITIPASVTTISQESVGFHNGTKLQNLVIRGAAGSAAESYAKENGFTFVEIGATSGKCGENLTWSVDAEGTLTISGTGAMWDYTSVSEDGNWRTTAPWYVLSPVKLVLNEGISYIGCEAFRGCGFAGSLTIPKSVTRLGREAFRDCQNLTNVVIPASLTSIKYGAFYGCTGLTSVTIPEGVTAIEVFAFRNCSRLTGVVIPEGVTCIPDFAFDGCAICGENLTWILTEDGVLTISGTGEMTDYPNFADVPWNAYREKILSVVMEPGVTSVGRYAFFQCINMTSVEMPEGVTSIGNNAFSACRNLTSVVIPESVTNIGFAAFMACNGLTSITIPAGVASISSTSFGACFILENIFVDEGNTVYASADGILFNKDQTTLITYPAGKKNTTYIIPEGVTNIASCAVYNCGYLTSVTIPRSVASIGDNAFDFCYNLRDISVDEGNEAYASVDGVLFNKERTVLVTYPAGKENTAYTIPDGVTNVGRSAFWDCMLTSIVIPESVTKIEWGAFRDCSNLKDVYYVGSQRQWEQVQIAEYNEPLLNAAIHFSSVGPCPELTLDREYITLSVGAEPVQLQSFPEYARKVVVWSVENPGGVNVIEVSGDGYVTPLNAGTAYVVASLNTGDGTLTARCRVDVTGTAGSEEVLGIDLGTKKVTTELYSTDYAKIDILPRLKQNEIALFAMQRDNGSTITGAYLEDENARQFFDLRVKDDRQLLLVPTQEALDDAKGVKSSYSSKIVVLVNGVEYHTDDAVTISVKKTMPKLKAANLTFNPFYTEQSQALTITGGTVTKVEGTTPDWLTMDGTKLTLSNAPKSGRASLNLLVYTTEWAIPVNVKASVKLSYKAPRLKLSASSITLSETDSLGVTVKLTAGKQSLEELNVKSVTLPAGFEDTELNLYTGEIALVPIGEIPTGKQAVRVSFYGTDSVLDLPLRVNKRTPTLRLSKTSVSLNAELGDSMTLKVTATPADLDLAKVTVTNPSEALELSPVNENGEFTVTVKQGSASKASYALMVQAPTGKAVKLTVKTLAAGQKVTMSLKAAGSIDLTFPEKGVALQPKYRNYAGELENVVYTLALKQGKVTLDAAFDDYLTIGEDGLIRWNGTGSLESGNVCLITMTGELPNGTMLFATAQVKVTQTPVILRLSKASLSLNKRLEEKTQVTVTTSTRGYTLGDVELLVTDNKNVPSDGLTAAYENGLLTLSVNEKTVYGGSYKVQLWVTPKRVTTLMVRIPAEKKSSVTMTARARGGIDVIRDASEVIVTPTYRNCLDGASLKKQVKVTWAQDGRNYSQDVTEDFILTWAQDGTLHVSKVPGKRLALTGKYRLEILCEGMEKEAYAALSVKCGTARFTVASVSLYAKDANDMARLTITTTDKTVNTLERVELKDARLKGTYEVLDLGGGQFALCLIPGAKAKTGTATLNLFCEGNTTAKPSGTVSVKVEIR